MDLNWRGRLFTSLDVAAIQCKDRTKLSSDKIDLVFASRSATERNFFEACESVNQTE